MAPRTDGGPVIVTRGLTKRFGAVTAVDGIDLAVDEGDRYGFLGPNGSGKTTTVRMLLGLVFADAGEIELLGHRVPQQVGAALPDVGALVEAPAAYRHLSARTNLDLLEAAGPRHRRLGRRARRERIEEVLDLVGLGGVGRRPVGGFSLGMRQRLGLAAALLDRPRLLVLDEPTNGLDPQGIGEVRALLLRLNEGGTTVFLSSHLLAEVEQTCTRVGVMDGGRLVAQLDMAQVRRPTGLVLLRVGDTAAARRLLGDAVVSVDGADGAGGAGGAGEQLMVRGEVPGLTRHLVGAGIDVLEAVPQRRGLEELVLELTGPGSDRADRTGGARDDDRLVPVAPR